MEGWVKAEVPDEHKTSEKGYARAVKDFYASGMECVRRDFGDDTVKAYVAMLQAARRNKLPVKVVKRGTIIYLVKEQ